MNRQCDELYAAIAEFIREVPEDQLTVNAFPEGWSVAKNIRHINRSTRLFMRWTRAPRWLIALRGKAKNPGRVEKLTATNRPPHYDYGTYQKRAPAPAGLRQQLIDELMAAADFYKQSLALRTEEELDSLMGLFGGSLRTFSLFTLKHASHHVGVAKKRFQQVAAASQV